MTEYRDEHGVLIPARAYIPTRYRILREHRRFRWPRWLRWAWGNHVVIIVAMMVAAFLLGFWTAYATVHAPRYLGGS